MHMPFAGPLRSCIAIALVLAVVGTLFLSAPMLALGQDAPSRSPGSVGAAQPAASAPEAASSEDAGIGGFIVGDITSSGDIRSFELAIDRAGDVSAVWTRLGLVGVADLHPTTIWASRYAAEGSRWDKPDMLADCGPGHIIALARVAEQAPGEVSALWLDKQLERSRPNDSLVMRTRGRTSPWSKPQVLRMDAPPAHVSDVLISPGRVGEAIGIWPPPKAASPYRSAGIWSRPFRAPDARWEKSQVVHAAKKESIERTVEDAKMAFIHADPHPDLPMMVTGVRGDALAVWVQQAGDAPPQLLAAHRPANTPWREALPVSRATAKISQAMAAVDAQGNAMVIWIQAGCSGGEGDLCASWFNAKNQSWGQPVQVSKEDGEVESISLATHPAGTVAASWLQRRKTLVGEEVQASVYNPSTAQWSPPHRLDRWSRPQGSRTAAVAFKDERTAMFVWQFSWVNGYSIQASQYDLSQDRWSPVARIHAEGAPYVRARSLAIAVGPQGMAAVGWVRSLADEADRLEVARFDPQKLTWNAPSTVPLDEAAMR